MKLKSIFKKFGKEQPKNTDVYIFSLAHENLLVPYQIGYDPVIGRGYAFVKGYDKPLHIGRETLWCHRGAFNRMLKQELYAIQYNKVRVDDYVDNTFRMF